ncbi:MAG: hypothetical protein JOZ72_09415 [Alphaproteobacteria bacterium]|nr:hypothetical protein [Alphaproteobacteria bacterium]
MAGAPKSSSSLTGPLLAVLFVLVFGSVLLLISALQLQRSVQTIKDPDVHATVGSVRLDILTLNNRELLAGKRAEQYDQIRNDRGRYSAQMGAAITQMLALHRALERAVYSRAAQYSSLTAADTQMLPADRGPPQGLLPADQRLTAYEEAARAKGVAANEPRTEIGKFLTEVNADTDKILSDYAKAQKDWMAAYAADQQAAMREKDLTNPLPEPAGNLKKESYRSVVEDFRAYEALLGRFSNLVMIPNAMLVLLLSIFMGMLGSLIFLARKLVLDREDTGYGEIASRVGLGAAVALALFFFASAGMLAMSQAGAGPDSNDMSPYLIAFLGITAGYLSDRVTAWMREVGERTFKLESGAMQSRWAVGLGTALAAQNIGAAELAAGTDVSEDDLADWIALKKPVPAEEQRLIAVYLRRDASLLFTDVKPRGTPPPPTPQPAA